MFTRLNDWLDELKYWREWWDPKPQVFFFPSLDENISVHDYVFRETEEYHLRLVKWRIGILGIGVIIIVTVNLIINNLLVGSNSIANVSANVVLVLSAVAYWIVNELQLDRWEQESLGERLERDFDLVMQDSLRRRLERESMGHNERRQINVPHERIDPFYQEDIEGKRRLVKNAYQMKVDYPQMTWREIANKLGMPERTLRDWRNRYR